MGIASTVRPDRTPTVYGVLLNDTATLQRLDAELHRPPYLQPPRAPVLYVKPRNTFAAEGDVVGVPTDPGEVRVNATLGLVIGRRATRVRAADAAAHVAGLVIASDLALPHENLHRPAIRQRCRDGFLPLGAVVPVPRSFDITRVSVRSFVNDGLAHERGFSAMVRSPDRLLQDVTEFMTLDPGDILLLGDADTSAVARAGDRVRIEADGLGSLTYRIGVVVDATQGGRRGPGTDAGEAA